MAKACVITLLIPIPDDDDYPSPALWNWTELVDHPEPISVISTSYRMTKPEIPSPKNSD